MATEWIGLTLNKLPSNEGADTTGLSIWLGPIDVTIGWARWGLLAKRIKYWLAGSPPHEHTPYV